MRTDDPIAQVLKSKPQNKVISITPGQTVYDALELMAHYDIGALLVCNGDSLLGILSERDYARKCVLAGHPSRETPVEDIMTRHVLSVTPQHTVDECLGLMTEHRFRHLPVVDNERVIGLISIGDLVKWVIGGQQEAIAALEGYITGGYPS